MDRTIGLLADRRALLETTAWRLLEKETLDEAELLQLVSTRGPQPADWTLVQLEQDRSGSRSAQQERNGTARRGSP
jgi:cell division protease FtsH